MTNPVVALISSFDPNLVWGGLKLMYLIAFGLYAAFSLVVLVQIRQMVTALQTGFDATLKLVGWVHFLVAVGALLLAFMVL